MSDFIKQVNVVAIQQKLVKVLGSTYIYMNNITSHFERIMSMLIKNILDCTVYILYHKVIIERIN